MRLPVNINQQISEEQERISDLQESVLANGWDNDSADLLAQLLTQKSDLDARVAELQETRVNHSALGERISIAEKTVEFLQGLSKDGS